MPERILDAPELVNDYYLNLLDWSADNRLAVALGENVYLWNAGRIDFTMLHFILVLFQCSVITCCRQRRDPSADGPAGRRRLRVLRQVHPRRQLHRRRDTAGRRRVVGRRRDEEGAKIQSTSILFLN